MRVDKDVRVSGNKLARNRYHETTLKVSLAHKITRYLLTRKGFTKLLRERTNRHYLSPVWSNPLFMLTNAVA